MRLSLSRRSTRSFMLATTAIMVVGWTTPTLAQEAQEQATEVDEIIVVGSQIRGAKVTAALPVTVVSEEQILATAATSGDDLLRSIPQMGDVTFNSSFLPASSNSARGDTGSVNLRNLGIGNTLVLLNGRRVVGHPTSQANEQLVPVLTYNTNAIPVSGLRRLEVLRDGAAAIYGADAVAGVINTVLRDDMNGLTVSAQYGAAEGTGLSETNLSLYGGRDIAEGQGNISLFLNYDDRSELKTTDQDYTASLDKRALFTGTGFENAATLNSRSSLTAWGLFRPTGATVRLAGATSNLTAFSRQPASFTGCSAPAADGICVRSGTVIDSRLFSDSAAQGLTVMPEVKRLNAFLTGRYDLNDNVEAFGELGYYHAETTAFQAPISTLSSVVVTIPRTNFYNPFGATLINGVVNPNRLTGITAPAAGVDLLLSGYRFEDLGPIEVNVTNDQYRLLGGLRGDWNGWNWESALVYSEASAEDISDNVSNTALQRQLALSTADAYNPFNGGDLNNFSFGDGTPSSTAALNAIRVKMRRYSETTLALGDFKVSRPDLFRLPGGDLGFAAGVEARRETQLDDRDQRIDGTITYTDPSGAVYSDLVNSSLSPDTTGERDVYSAYAEFAVPIVSPEMNIPLVYRLEGQIAGRFEHYSDFGDVAKPKVAVAWDMVDGIRFRGSWAQGFRAPNLEQINATIVTRSNSSTDWIYCEALIRRRAMASFAGCGATPTLIPGFADTASINTVRVRRLVAEQRAGNPDLQPEESETLSFGTVIQPDFSPAGIGDFTFTADWWQVEQTGMVGVFRGQNALTLDYLLRKQGLSNPNVVRAAPTADDIRIFAGTGLAPAGEILYVKDLYDNLQPQTVEGFDFGAIWNLNGTRFGDFNVNLNVSHLLTFYLEPSPGIQGLIDAKAQGQIDPLISFAGSAGNLIRNNSRPEWKWSLSATWRYENISVGAFTSYTGSVEQDALLDPSNQIWVVDSLITGNLYGEYEFDQAGALDGTAVRVGVRNLTNEQPPLASDGYLGTVYTPYSRYWYVNLRKSF